MGISKHVIFILQSKSNFVGSSCLNYECLFHPKSFRGIYRCFKVSPEAIKSRFWSEIPSGQCVWDISSSPKGFEPPSTTQLDLQTAWDHTTSSILIRGHREGGPTACSKKFQKAIV